MGTGTQNCNCSLTETRARKASEIIREETETQSYVLKFIPSQKEQGRGSTLASGCPGQGSFPTITFINLSKPRAHFRALVFAMEYRINNHGQDEISTPDRMRGQPGGHCSGLAR